MPTAPPDSSGRIHLVVGRKACGKTTLAIQLTNKLRRENPQHRVVVVNPTRDRRLRSDLIDLPDHLAELSRCLLFVDEVRLYSSPHLLPAALRRFLLEIWHRDNYLIGTSRRLSDLHQDLISSADYLYLFRLSSARDLETARSYLPAGIARDRLPSLAQFAFFRVAL